jgi:hypothetical protein
MFIQVNPGLSIAISSDQYLALLNLIGFLKSLDEPRIRTLVAAARFCCLTLNF